MKRDSLFKRLFMAMAIVFSIFFLSGCGYKPSTTYAKKELGQTIYVNLTVDLEDPKNSVLIKDAMNELIVNKLGRRLVYQKDQAQTVMNIKMNSVSLSELSYSEDGYNKLYKANVSISVNYLNQDKKRRSFSVSGSYDFSIEDGAIISDTKRFEAIRNASDKALDEVISKMAIQRLKKKNVKKNN